MELLDPTVRGPEQQHKRAAPLASLEGSTIGLLSNGKSNADLLIRKTAEKLIAKYGGKHLEVVYKNHASVPAARELLTNLSHECDFLITAAGD